jgi:predicted RND superfamily exporter protein
MDRLRPIIMTTASTGCGFLPMAVSVGASSDLWSPLAVTVIGGLLSSTILTLFILPNFILISTELGQKFGKLTKIIKDRIQHFVTQFRYQLSQTANR